MGTHNQAKAKKTTTDEGVTFEFAHGSSHALNLSDLSEEIVHQLALHGLSQKVGDAYAGAKTSEEAEESAIEMITRLKDGEWKATRESSGSSSKSGSSMLLDALIAVTGKTKEQCLTVLENMEDDQKKALRKHPAIAGKIAQIQAERAAAKAAEAVKAAEGISLEI